MHFSTLDPKTRKWVNLCGHDGDSVHGTLVIESEITCVTCKQMWKLGMRRVHHVLGQHQGEE